MVWTSLSATSLFYYHSDDLSTSWETYSYLGNVIYIIYLANGNNKHVFLETFIFLNWFHTGNYAKQYVADIVIGADEFSYFMYIYLVLSFVWFIVSALTLWGRGFLPSVSSHSSNGNDFSNH